MTPGLRQTIGSAARTLRGLVTPHPLILCYHRVADLRSDPQMLAVGPTNFERHMEILHRSAVPATLDELVPGTTNGRELGRRVAVTFDDGYADNLEIARPILERHQIPATVFVVAGMVGSREEFWWDELERLLLRSATPTVPLELEFDDQVHAWGLNSITSKPLTQTSFEGWTVLDPIDPSPIHRLYRELITLFREATPEGRDAALSSLRSWAASGCGGRPTHRVLNRDELRALVEDDLVTVGSHALRHVRFADLSLPDQLHELTESRSRLEAMSGRTVDQFAYPFGSLGDLPTDNSSDLRAAGYRLACANFEGTVGMATDHFRLPRMLVRDWPAEEFARRLAQWFGHRPA